MDPKELRAFAKSHKFIAFLTGVGFLIIALVIFEAGEFVGFQKASFADGWEQNYGRDFGDPRGQYGLPGGGLPNSHGADGRIASLTSTSFIVTGDGDEVEKTISYSSTTVIRLGRDATTSAALKAGSYVVVIGDPDASGTVAAQLIRVLPPPEDMPASSAQ